MFRFVNAPFLIRNIFSQLIWEIKSDEKVIYLTFDDGPTPDVTDSVLDCLNRFNAKATFFCLGKNVQSYHNIFQNIINDGHSVGNHTYSHINGWEAKNEVYFNDVQKCHDVFKSTLFRPPYGRISPYQIKSLQQQYKIIMWSTLSYDFAASVNEELCWKYVNKNVRPGSVIVFHDSLKAKENVLSVLPKFLAKYSELSYTFKAIDPIPVNRLSPLTL